jgi:ATP adenylyltransferase
MFEDLDKEMREEDEAKSRKERRAEETGALPGDGPRLWSPWRMEYIRTAREGTNECIFCELQSKDDTAAHILKRTPRAFALMNAFPYNPGHLMVAPYRHVASIENLDEDEMAHVGRLLQESLRVLRASVGPDGFNVGVNVGRVAGAGFPGHVHWHVVPRWNGDVNFMPVTAGTRVLPEMIDETFAKMRPAFAQSSSDDTADPTG